MIWLAIAFVTGIGFTIGCIVAGTWLIMRIPKLQARVMSRTMRTMMRAGKQ